MARGNGVPRWLIEDNDRLHRKVDSLEKEVTRLRKLEKIQKDNSVLIKRMVKIARKQWK